MPSVRNRIVRLCLTAICLFVLLWLLWGNMTVGLTSITLNHKELPTAFDGYRIAHVSDLHNSLLWPQAIEKLQQGKPDIICITGDLVDGFQTDVDRALNFIEEAVKIAPCFYVTGNHEMILDAAQWEQLFNGLCTLGVTILDSECTVLGSEAEHICIAGIGWGSRRNMDDMSSVADFTVLLAHAPENVMDYASYGFDLVLSGHAHGGQFRIPFVGGVYAPGQGLFPDHDSGLYHYDETRMIVSRGVGNSIIPIRFNNRPEVILLVLEKE